MKRRFYNLFGNDGKAVVIAFDHGRDGRVMGVDNGAVIRAARDAGADAILLPYGLAKYHKADIGKMGLIVRMDTTSSALDARKPERVPDIAYQVETMARFGADAVMLLQFPGDVYDYEMTQNAAKLVEECDRYGILSATEMLPYGFSTKPEDHSVYNMGVALRQGAALGLDFIKTQFVGEAEEFAKEIATCEAPVLTLGSGKRDEKEFLQFVRHAMDAGCKGVICGKNVWQCKDVAGMIRALNKIVHEDASAEEAYAELSL
ncbi:MAG: hypothetical protein IJM26_10230 [Lachnospiraceae bacterium]|nr:hypothetical protein [Lachnospiraceae bacterium]